MFLLLAIAWRGCQEGASIEHISYSAFKEAVSKGKVQEIVFEGEKISGLYKAQTGKPQVQESSQGQRHFQTIKPAVADSALLPLLEKHGVVIRAKSSQSSAWLLVLVNLLPWILLIGLVFIGMRRMAQNTGGAGSLFNFGRSPAKRYLKTESNVTFTDVAGLQEAKEDLKEIIGYLRETERYRKLGAKIPRGVLLMGPPGTGKTLLARATAGEANVPFFSISASEFIEMFVGIGASRVRDMFKTAKELSPSIIFIDELDAVGRTRGTGIGGGHDEREQTLNQILSEMDGFAPSEPVVVTAATNRPDVLDPALLRPGRFDRKVVLPLPDRRARKRILEVHARRVPLATDVDLGTIAAATVGFAGANLQNLVNEAALLSARHRRQVITMEMLWEARDKLILGAQRVSMLTEEQKRLVAYHEAGHALLAWLLPKADPIEKVTIIPRGHALGITAQMPSEERYHLSESYLRERIEVMLGGRVSERLVFGEVTSGSEQDLKEATQFARRMVSQWGMSDRLGAVAFRRGEQHVFLGQEMAQERDYSERTAQLIDEEVRRLIGDLERDAHQRLKSHRDQLELLEQALLERETLNAAEMREVLHTEPASNPKCLVAAAT